MKTCKFWKLALNLKGHLNRGIDAKRSRIWQINYLPSLANAFWLVGATTYNKCVFAIGPSWLWFHRSRPSLGATKNILIWLLINQIIYLFDQPTLAPLINTYFITVRVLHIKQTKIRHCSFIFLTVFHHNVPVIRRRCSLYLNEGGDFDDEEKVILKKNWAVQLPTRIV